MLFYSLTLHAASSLDLFAYSNVDSANWPNNHKSISGYCAFFGNKLVSWFAINQKVVSWSSIESEYRVVANATSNLVWIQL